MEMFEKRRLSDTLLKRVSIIFIVSLKWGYIQTEGTLFAFEENKMKSRVSLKMCNSKLMIKAL